MKRASIAIALWVVAGLAPANIAVSQSSQCSSAHQCQFPLLCDDGRCRLQCQSYRDCGSGEICVDAPRSKRDYKMCVDVDSYGEAIPPFHVGYDRPGDDIRAVPLPVFSPKLCHYVCKEETSERCFFWTIVKPGAQEKTAMCWLKRGPGTLRRNSNTVSSGNPFGDDRPPP